jgi:protein subunit release factor A
MKLDKKEFKVIFTRGTGPGGQHRNKVETCCVITHIPSGITQRCQASRSKMTNYETALKLVLTKLQDLKKQAQHEKLNSVRHEKLVTVIRTYNFQRHEVKDYTSGKTARLELVLDGNLELLR